MKKWMNRVLAAALSLTMALGVCSCGKDEQAEEKNRLSKEHVYRMEEVGIPVDADDMNVRGMTYMNDRIYLLVVSYDYEIGDGRETTTLLSMKVDGTDVQKISLEMPEPYHKEVTEDTNADTTNQYSGTVTLPTSRTEVLLDAAIAVPDISAEEVEEWVDPGYYENTYYGEYFFSTIGHLYAVENYSYENYSDPEKYVFESKSSLVCWDFEGKLQWRVPLTDNQDDGNSKWISGIAPMADGGITVLMMDNEQKVYGLLIGTDGTAGEARAIAVNPDILNNSNGIVFGPEGKVYWLYYDAEWKNMYLAELDTKSGTVSEGVLVPAAVSNNGYNQMVPGKTKDILYATYEGIYGFNVGDTEVTKLMDYLNSDLSIGNMQSFVEIDENRFIGVYRGQDWRDLYASVFTKVAPEDVADKKVLTLAGLSISSDIREAVINYNRNNSEYKILLKDYYKDMYLNNYDDYMQALKDTITRMNNDITSGNMPDILLGTTELDLTSYAAKGLFADISKLIEEDEELDESDYLTNVFEAYKVDGKLYYVLPRFYVNTFLTNSDVVGKKNTLTLDELKALLAEREDRVAFEYVTQEQFLNLMLTFNGTDFVDPAKGTCNFNSPEFISLLEFAKTLPTEINYDEDGEDDYYTRYTSGKYLMCQFHIGDFSNMSYYQNGLLGGKANYTGFPNQEDSTSVMSAYEAFAISQKSPNKDGAWAFLRQYLTKDYQETVKGGLPVMTSVFEEKSKDCMSRPYWTDENGEKVEYDNTIWINNEEVIIPPLNQEQCDELVSFIKSVDKVSYSNQDIQNLVLEDAAAFFNGQKSAQEVATIIQSRVQIFVDENM